MPDLYHIWAENAKAMDTKDVILRVSLSPYRKGHIQEIYEIGWAFGWGDKSKFLLLAATITKAQFDAIMDGRILKINFMEVDGGFISQESFDQYFNNRKIKGLNEFEKFGIQPKIFQGQNFKLMNLAMTLKDQVVNAPMRWRDKIEVHEMEGGKILAPRD